MQSREYIYDCGVEAAAEMLERLAACTKDEAVRDTYLNGAAKVRYLKESYYHTDNPYSFLIAKEGLDIKDPDIVPLPKAPPGYTWLVVEVEGGLYFVCYQEDKHTLVNDLKLAMCDRGMFGSPTDGLGLPLDHLVNYGIYNVLKISNKQIEWPPLKVKKTYWKNYLKVSTDELSPKY